MLLTKVLAGILLLLSFTNNIPVPSSVINENIKSSKFNSSQVEPSDEYKLLAEVPGQNIRLYAVDYEGGKWKSLYKKLLLEVKGRRIIYNWKRSTAVGPQLALSDLNSDSSKELIVILTTGTGTGVREEDLHVLNLDGLKEIKVIDPLTIIKKRVHTNIKDANGNKLIQINVDEKMFEIVKKASEGAVWFDSVGFGAITRWEVKNNTLCVEVPAQVTPAWFIGSVFIEYSFKDNVLNAKGISFKEYK